MKETVADIKNRRSVKEYKKEQISDAELMEVLEAGMNAPSGGNRQSAIFIVVQNREWIDKLCVLNAKIAGAPEGWDVFYGAPTVIVVAASTETTDTVKDGSLAIGNMLNAAYALGLGARWINRADGMLEDELGKQLLKEAGYEGDYVGVGNVILGYPAGDFPAPIEHKKDYYRIIR
jgi:nitroreductase